MILVRALYFLKVSGASWRSKFKKFIENNLHFKLTQINPGVYIRRNSRENNGMGYYELFLVYVDYFLAVSHSPKIRMKYFGLEFGIKDNKYGPPTAYLGANFEPFHISE